LIWRTSRSWFLPAAQIKNALYFSSKLDFESVWINEAKQRSLEKKDSPGRLEKWAYHLDICGKRVDR
jgi:hypothetical protein